MLSEVGKQGNIYRNHDVLATVFLSLPGLYPGRLIKKSTSGYYSIALFILVTFRLTFTADGN